VILHYFLFNPKAKLRLEVLFGKFHPRINLATLYSTKSYLLNTIKPFSGHENRSLTKSQKPWQGGTLRNFRNLLGTWTLKSEYAGHKVGLKDSGSQNFSSIGLMVEAVGGARDRRNLLSLFFMFYDFLSVKHDLSKRKFSKFLE
jgi:hypothetical protein